MICYVVKLKEVSSISPKAYKVEDYQGNTEIIPKSQMCFKRGNEWWCSRWILNRKSLVYSVKSICNVDFRNMREKPMITIETKVPEKIEFDGTRDIEELKR